MAFWYLFNSIIRKVSDIIIALEYLLLEVISKKFRKKEVLFNY